MEITEQMIAERQHILDIAKWLASETAGYDLCGTLAYCPYCDKAETHPCARAEARMHAALAREEAAYRAEQAELEAPAAITEEPASDASAEETTEAATEETTFEETATKEAAPEEETPAEALEEIAVSVDDKPSPEGYAWTTRYRRSFRARLIQNEKAQDFYTELRNALAALTDVRARVSQACESFRLHRRRIARIGIVGKTLILCLALDPAAYEDTKYRFEDVSDRKTYAETPMKLRVTSKRMVKYAKELIADLAKAHGVEETAVPAKDYHFPYEDDGALIAKGLIKPYRALVRKRT